MNSILSKKEIQHLKNFGRFEKYCEDLARKLSRTFYEKLHLLQKRCPIPDIYIAEIYDFISIQIKFTFCERGDKITDIDLSWCDTAFNYERYHDNISFVIQGYRGKDGKWDAGYGDYEHFPDFKSVVTEIISIRNSIAKYKGLKEVDIDIYLPIISELESYSEFIDTNSQCKCVECDEVDNRKFSYIEKKIHYEKHNKSVEFQLTNQILKNMNRFPTTPDGLDLFFKDKLKSLMVPCGRGPICNPCLNELQGRKSYVLTSESI